MFKKIVLFFICYLLLHNAQAQELNVMTFNIRYDNPGDSMNAWPLRKDNAASQILFHEATIVGVQEALHHQLQDLQQRLKEYKWVGGGRDDGKMKGEYSAIFFDNRRLELLQSKTFWLSEHPDSVGIKGWDAALPRVVTWAKFRDRKTKKIFYHFNTHFDHMGMVARKHSASLLLEKVNAIAGEIPVIITGDFNAHPDDEPIQVLTDAANRLHFTDTKSVSLLSHYGPSGTFNAFRDKEINDQPIDYIFIKKGITVLQHATLSQSWMGRFSSDHFPVFAKLRLK